jgi:phospholipase C
MIKVRVSRPLRSILSPLAATFSLLLVLAGCGSVGPGSTAPTVTITASPTSIAAGASSTLTVAATNATSVTVTGSDGSSYTMPAAGGTQSVKPAKTTTYTATANGASGSTPATATATVTVGGASTAPTVTITANPASIAAGGSSTLTVTATNATTVTVTGSDGSSKTLAATGGTLTVTPAATTTYTATATGATGTTPATATATVTVTGSAAPTVTVVANPTTIVAGTSSTLTIVATNATSVTVAGSDGTSYTLAAATGGIQKVSPSATTTYTVTATGAGGSATATATVTVTAAPPPPPAPVVTLTGNPTTITAGGSSTLTVTAQNATSLTIAGTDGSSFTQPALPVGGGTETITPKATTTYTATASNVTGNATATVIITVNQPPSPTVTIAANPASIATGGSSTLTVAATNATSVTVTGTDGSSYTLAASGGKQTVSPAATTTYTATADGAGGTAPATASATVTIVPAGSVQSIDHVIFMLQENHTFDDYFGMLNPYRANNNYNVGDDGITYSVDGIDDKVNGKTYTAVRGATVLSNKDKQGAVHTLYPLKSTCLDDMSSAWEESFGDVSLGNFLTTRPIKMNGYTSNGDGFANSKCPGGVGPCTGYTDTTGDRTMGYYDQNFLNYYYYMASQFALSDRWFSPIESKSIPNRIATDTGGTTQGLVNDPSGDDHLSPLTINNIFQNLDTAKVSWKVYYTVNNGACDPEDCNKTQSGSSLLPASTFTYLTYAFKYVGGAPPCTAPKVPSSVVGDSSNSFCIDPTHIAPLRDPTYGYFADLKNGTLPSFGFIESGSGLNDEHPGYQQSVLAGQNQVSQIINGLMNSTSWKDSAFFLAYDEGGGPYDHVPPVPGHTNDFTDASAAANYPTDVTGISVQPDSFYPCVPTTPGTPTVHCDLTAGQSGSNTGDAAGPPPGSGFGAQVGFRVPNMVVSPFVRKHYVSHVPMDHTAVIRFVEDRFIGNGKYLTARDAAQPNLLDFFDFTGVPWATPPTQTATPPPTPTAIGSSCQPSAFH